MNWHLLIQFKAQHMILKLTLCSVQTHTRNSSTQPIFIPFLCSSCLFIFARCFFFVIQHFRHHQLVVFKMTFTKYMYGVWTFMALANKINIKTEISEAHIRSNDNCRRARERERNYFIRYLSFNLLYYFIWPILAAIIQNPCRIKSVINHPVQKSTKT